MKTWLSVMVVCAGAALAVLGAGGVAVAQSTEARLNFWGRDEGLYNELNKIKLRQSQEICGYMSSDTSRFLRGNCDPNKWQNTRSVGSNLNSDECRVTEIVGSLKRLKVFSVGSRTTDRMNNQRICDVSIMYNIGKRKDFHEKSEIAIEDLQRIARFRLNEMNSPSNNLAVEIKALVMAIQILNTFVYSHEQNFDIIYDGRGSGTFVSYGEGNCCVSPQHTAGRVLNPLKNQSDIKQRIDYFVELDNRIKSQFDLILSHIQKLKRG